MENELWGIYKSYDSQKGHFLCYRCHEYILDDIQFTVHIMKKESMEFRHYHIKCAPKKKINYVLSRLETKKRT